MYNHFKDEIRGGKPKIDWFAIIVSVLFVVGIFVALYYAQSYNIIIDDPRI